MTHPPLYIWLDSDPLAMPADLTIDDVPGISDIDLVAEAIARGRLGRILPTRISISPHAKPHPRAVRTLDTGRLLRDYQLPYRQRLELLTPPVEPE